MIEIVQAPNLPTCNGVKLFLAGGISNCPHWQDEIIEKLLNEEKLKKYNTNIIIFNPRCKEIPEEKPQTIWEYNNLKKSHIVSFWFSVGSLNPITLFEYGVHLNSNKKLVVGCHPDYLRKNAVFIQTELKKPKLKVNNNFEDFYNELVKSLINILDKRNLFFYFNDFFV